MTQHKAEEQYSSSIFNQPLPGAPVTDFSSYINPEDSIREQDLVLWITSGLMHYPGSEDAPVTPTTGSTMGFVLRPFNFFDENAAIDLADVVYVPGQVVPELVQKITGNASATEAPLDEVATYFRPFCEMPVEQQCMPSLAAAVAYQPWYGPTIEAEAAMDGGNSVAAGGVTRGAPAGALGGGEGGAAGADVSEPGAATPDAPPDVGVARGSG